MGYMFMRCEVATFPNRFRKLSPPLFCYFSSSTAFPWFGMQQQRGSPCSLFSCQSPLCTKMLIGPNPPLEAVLVAWPRTLKDTLVWNTKEPIQVPEKRGTEHSNTIQFPSRKRGELKGGEGRKGGVWPRMEMGEHHHSDNKRGLQSSGCCDVHSHNHVLASTSRDSHSPTGHRNASWLKPTTSSPTHTHTKWQDNPQLMVFIQVGPTQTASTSTKNICHSESADLLFTDVDYTWWTTSK